MRAWLLGLLALTLLSPTARADRERAAEHYRKGMAEFVLKNYDAAVTAFEQGFREEQQPAFLYNIAQCHEKQGRPALAVDFYQRYLELTPGAADRAEVEAKIAALREAARPVPPRPEPPRPEPVVVAPPPVAAPAPVKARPRWPLWVGIAAGVVVVGAAATVIGVLASPPAEQSLGKLEY